MKLLAVGLVLVATTSGCGGNSKATSRSTSKDACAKALAEARKAVESSYANRTSSLPIQGKPNEGCGTLTLTETMQSKTAP